MLIRTKIDGQNVWVNLAFLKGKMEDNKDEAKLSVDKRATTDDCVERMVAWLSVFADRFKTRDFVELLHKLTDAICDLREEYEPNLEDEEK